MSDLTKGVDATVAAATGDATAVSQAAGQATRAAGMEMQQAQGWLRRHVWALVGGAVVLAAIAIALLVR